jgi:hypothetical protein
MQPFYAFRPAFRNLLLLSLVLSVPSLAQTGADSAEPNRDPMKARLVTSDIPNFWRVFDKALLKDAADLYQREYIDAGSPGLHGFLQGRIVNGRNMAATVAARPRYYAAIRESTLTLDQRPEVKAAIQASFRRLKEIYPAAIFPDVYFLIGCMNSAGTTDGGKGLLIGVEMNARNDSTPIDELNNWERAVTGHIADLPKIVAHELIHIEQRRANPQREINSRGTLLERALAEGGADFLGEMISGGTINRVQRVYGDGHEQELWTEFSAAMHGTDSSHWMYEGDRAKNRPADMGYYEGYKIWEAFYKRATDKPEAIRRILATSDADAVLKESRYGETFPAGGGGKHLP